MSGVGNAMDLPGSVVRDILAGRNPIDQIATPFSDQNRTTGRQLARDYGMAGSQDNWGNYLGGMAAEMAFDPLSYVGVGMLGKAGKAMSRNPLDNLAADGMSQAGRYAGNVQNALTHRNYMATHNPPTNSYLDMLDDAVGPAPVDDAMFNDIPFVRQGIDNSRPVPLSRVRPNTPPGRGTTGVYGKGGDGNIVGKPAIPDPYAHLDQKQLDTLFNENPGLEMNYYRNTAGTRLPTSGLPVTNERFSRGVMGIPQWWKPHHDDYHLRKLKLTQRQMVDELKDRWGTNKSYGFGDDLGP
jgi:hypothetical protein